MSVVDTSLRLTLHPTPSLHEPSALVSDFSENLTRLAEEMNAVMVRENGIGLAAPQIGNNIQLIIVKKGDRGTEYTPYVNPKITFRSSATVAIEEGCLSVPGLFGYVKRSAKIRITYYDLAGVKHTKKANGMEAIILQHEIDHINGALIINHPMEVTHGTLPAVPKKSRSSIQHS